MMDQPTLFELPPEEKRPAEAPSPGAPRLRTPQRDQVVMRMLALDQMLPPDDVINQGTDAGQLAPMVEQIERRTGVRPTAMLADGGFSTKDDLEALNDPEQGY